MTDSVLGFSTAAPSRPLTFTTSRPRVIGMLLGETLRLAPSGTQLLEVTREVEPEPASLDTIPHGFSITPAATGRHSYSVELANGTPVTCSVLVCEPGCLAHIKDQPNATSGVATDKRGVLRSLANHRPDFAGTAQEMIGLNLTPYGG